MGTSEINYFIFDFDFIMGNEMECNNIKTTKYRNKPAKKAGVKLYTIGIGEKGEFDSKLLSQMASDGSGEYFAAAPG